MAITDGNEIPVEDLQAAVAVLLRFRSAASEAAIRVRSPHAGRRSLRATYMRSPATGL